MDAALFGVPKVVSNLVTSESIISVVPFLLLVARSQNGATALAPWLAIGGQMGIRQLLHAPLSVVAVVVVILRC